MARVQNERAGRRFTAEKLHLESLTKAIDAALEERGLKKDPKHFGQGLFKPPSIAVFEDEQLVMESPDAND